MKILKQYIFKTMAFYTIGVMFIWLGVYAILNFITEIDKVGQANYTILKAILYVLLDLPSVLYSHSAVIILLGTILSFGHLVATSQLTIVLVNGISVIKVTLFAVISALIFMIIVIIFSESVSYKATEYAENYRAKALGKNIQSENQEDFWFRDKDSIINIKNSFDGHLLFDVMLIKLNEFNKIYELIYSKKALFKDEELEFINAKKYQLEYNEQIVDIKTTYLDKYNTKLLFDKKLILNLKKTVNKLSTLELYKYINFLKQNKLASGEFEVEFYKRIVKPFTLVTIILFSMLFVFGSFRDSSTANKVLLGLTLGLFFELISRIGGVLSLRFDYNSFFGSIMFTTIILFISIILLRKKSVKV
jgi:lipopolysaccharide export system permease protein